VGKNRGNYGLKPGFSAISQNTSLKTGAKFSGSHHSKTRVDFRRCLAKLAPAFKLGFGRWVKQPAHPRPFKREQQIHEPQNEMLIKEN
jgi:hypothetical protein